MNASFPKEELETAANTLLHEALRRATTFMQQFMHEPDHVAVIIASSKMDELLGSIIRQRVLPCPEKNDDLLDSERGLGSFSLRIMMAHRLGTIDASLARALHIIRRIRNDFAHTYEGQSLNTPPHSDRVTELGNRLSQHPNIVELRQALGAINPKLADHKLNFTIAATNVIAKLELASTLVRRLDATAAPHTKFP